jgi:thiamine-monophosphate kinase
MAAPANDGAAAETLADLGEWELIRRLGAYAPAGQFADDAALLPACGTGGGVGALVVNTDVLVEGLHFSDATTSAADVGWRAAAANLSDLAAMGCDAVVGLTVGLVAPASTPWPWVEGVYGGLRQALDRFGGELLGGDCSGGGQRLLAITALGRLAAAGGPIRRRDGRPGDRLLATGSHGLSRLGLALLQGELDGTGPDHIGSPDLAGSLDPSLAARAIAAHQRPVPRFDAVQALIASRPPGCPWRVGGCDSSDGLAAAVRAIAAPSGCAARLERGALPLAAAMAGLSLAQAWCLEGGEDFELVLALEPAWAEALAAALPGSGLIGELLAGPAGELRWSGSGERKVDGIGGGGYRHFG